MLSAANAAVLMCACTGWTRYWLVGLIIFFGMAAAAGAIPATLPPRTAEYDTALLCFFGLLLTIHAGTVYYASLRPGKLTLRRR